MIGVSFVVPVHNGAACVGEAIASILAQSDGRPMEIIVVEDGSRDNSAAVLESMTAVYPLTVIAGPGRGAAAAVNAGVRMARHPIICQVDQDVVLEPGWLTALVACLSNPAVAAAQGRYVVDGNASFFARITGLDLEQRYAHLEEYPNHVCTGNTAYRASALHAIGLLDDSMGYGYDNDLSYRLQAHTTSDDPTRYRTEEEVAPWRERDPIARCAERLRARDAFEDAFTAQCQQEAEDSASKMRQTLLAATSEHPARVFDTVYRNMPEALRRERDEFLASLEPGGAQ